MSLTTNLCQSAPLHSPRKSTFWPGQRWPLMIVVCLGISCAGCRTRTAETTAIAGELDTTASASEDSKLIETGFDDQLALGRSSQSDRIEIAAATIHDQQLMALTAQDEWLQILILDAGQVSDDGISAIARLPRLSHLRLRNSPITDQGLQQISNCPAIQILNLPHCQATADGIRQLAALPDLRSLRIGGPALAADTAAAVVKIQSLRNLHLIGVPIDDQGLQQIATLPKLHSLYLDDCAVTQTGWDWLFESHPDLHVHVNQKHLDRDPQNH